MKKEYDLSKMKRRRNPYAKQLKRQVTLRMSVEAIDYFKNLAEETGLPYQNLINLYLLDCALIGRKPNTHWSP
jgi:predicted DNA binding CopG/RHH family protein